MKIDFCQRYFKQVINGEPEAHDYVNKMKNGNSILVKVADLNLGNSNDCYRIQRVTEKLNGGDNGNQNELNASYFTGYQSKSYFRPQFSNSNQESIQQYKNEVNSS